MKHVMHNGNAFMKVVVDPWKQMLFIHLVLHTLCRVSCSKRRRTVSEESEF
jgi:hypothetical protein